MAAWPCLHLPRLGAKTHSKLQEKQAEQTSRLLCVSGTSSQVRASGSIYSVFNFERYFNVKSSWFQYLTAILS